MIKILLESFLLPALAFGTVAAVFGIAPGPWWARLWTAGFGFVFACLVAWLIAPPRTQEEE